MKYCVKCNKQLSDDACFCSKCGSAAVEQLPAEAEQKSGVSLLAQYVQSHPEVLQDHNRLNSVLRDVFPGEKMHCRFLEDVFEVIGSDLQNYSNFNEASAQQLGQLAAQKCLRPEAESRQAVLDWAFVLGKCSLAEAQKWRNVATNTTFSSQVASNVAPFNKASSFTNPSSFVSCRPGDYIQFGRYPQNNGDTPEPIDWLVLAHEGRSLLVISKYGLDCKKYHEPGGSVTWEQCTLRKWLNSKFMNAAFSNEEQSAIELSHLHTANGRMHGTSGGNDTDDKLFLLSIEEAEQYLAHGSSHTYDWDFFGLKYGYSNNSDLKVVATSFAINNGADEDAETGTSWFWLRSPGLYDNDAAYVDYDGGVNVFGGDVSSLVDGSVRPALRIIFPSTNATNQILQDASLTTNVNSASPVVANVVISNKFSHPTSNFVSCKAGEYIQFGRYPQNHGNTPEPIDWLVLSREGRSLLVISKYGLDCKPYNQEDTSVTWEECTLRKWLNSEFMNTAFSWAEQAEIQVSHLCNANNPEYGTNGGNDTDDKLFLLSIAEAGQYLANGSRCNKYSYCYEYGNDCGLKVVATSYAIGHGAYKANNGNGCFWLRSSGSNDNRAALVAYDGVHDCDDDFFDVYEIFDRYVSNGIGCVRPALRIILPS